MIHVNSDRIAIDDELTYKPMAECPLDCKVLLLSRDGVAVLGKLNAVQARDLWVGWFPLPKRAKE